MLVNILEPIGPNVFDWHLPEKRIVVDNYIACLVELARNSAFCLGGRRRPGSLYTIISNSNDYILQPICPIAAKVPSIAAAAIVIITVHRTTAEAAARVTKDQTTTIMSCSSAKNVIGHSGCWLEW